MSRSFETSLYVDAPAEVVWEVLSDVARWPQWTPTVTSVERLEVGPLRIGSQARLRQPRLREAVWEVTELVEGRLFTWQSKAPGVTTIGRHEVVPEGNGSRVTLGIEQAGPLGGMVALLWGRLTQRYIELEGESLAKRVARGSSA
jgi:uncharacterized membrane protein